MDGVRRAAADGYVRIVVKDTGQGIAPEFLPYVFDRFRQADPSTTRGLGTRPRSLDRQAPRRAARRLDRGLEPGPGSGGDVHRPAPGPADEHPRRSLSGERRRPRASREMAGRSEATEGRARIRLRHRRRRRARVTPTVHGPAVSPSERRARRTDALPAAESPQPTPHRQVARRFTARSGAPSRLRRSGAHRQVPPRDRARTSSTSTTVQDMSPGGVTRQAHLCQPFKAAARLMLTA